MIVMIGGEKGGTGKTTVATNLAVWLATQGRDVLLLDADPQGSAAGWCARRHEYHPEAPQVHSARQHGDIFATVRDLAGRYEDIIIDAGGRDSLELRTGMVAAQRLYMPLRPSQYDIETSMRTATVVKQARVFNRDLVAMALISLAPTNPTITEAKEARELLAELPEFTLSSAQVRERKVYRDAATEGLGVVEMNNSKAKAEIDAFKPDVVIAADDNASKYLIEPYFKDAALPFVFCGVNWDASTLSCH